MQRRIIILLDEADNFLNRKWNPISQHHEDEGLMGETGRRVKFVYAGLHNVQGFVRTPNSPMLHLGEPVNIGPLLGIDRHAARQMVFEPMAASGVGFRQPTDAHHMLSLVGYYPSLLQSSASRCWRTSMRNWRVRVSPTRCRSVGSQSYRTGFKASVFRFA
jgi:hypothetical protein